MSPVELGLFLVFNLLLNCCFSIDITKRVKLEQSNLEIVKISKDLLVRGFFKQ